MSNTIELAGVDEARTLSGPQDRNLRLVRERFGVDITIRDLKLVVRGEEATAATQLLGQLLERARQAGALPSDEVEAILIDIGRPPPPVEVVPAGDGRGRSTQPSQVEGFRLRTTGQKRYVGQMHKHDIVFAIGPAGTGKTFLAVLMAVQRLKAGEVKRIVLCRPAVEAGEHLGFLPGDFQAKVNPYMRPLYDALYAVLDYDTVKKYLEREVLEIAPLAYMRGRTLQDAFVILDEAQNTTKAQMKMFLTRMGERSRIVVTGDVTQIDLPRGTTSGLVHAQAILSRTQGISFVELTHKDIVRHKLVERILTAYEGPRKSRKQRR